jgi:hypothetical protein
MHPEIKEAIKIIIFELLITKLLLNANSVMKIDMVNPMPPRKPTAESLLQLIPLGKLVSLSLIAR